MAAVDAGSSSGGLGSRKRPNGVVSRLEVVALAHQEAQRALALAVVGGRLAVAAAQQRERRVELRSVVVAGERRPDVLARDAVVDELALDPVGAPAIEQATVLGEALREPAVVEIALLAQLRDHALHV